MIPTCRETTERVTDAREGALTVWERVRYWMHLGMCHHCRRYVRQLDVTTQELGALREAEPGPAPDATKAALLEKLRAGRREG